MAPRVCLWLPALLAAVSCVEGFVPLFSIPTSGGALRGRDDFQWHTSTRVASRAPWTCRPRRDTRRHELPGPDGRDIDIIRHREAYSYPEYWEDFYAG